MSLTKTALGNQDAWEAAYDALISSLHQAIPQTLCVDSLKTCVEVVPDSLVPPQHDLPLFDDVDHILYVSPTKQLLAFLWAKHLLDSRRMNGKIYAYSLRDKFALLDITLVIILYLGEHLTAINVRKEILVSGVPVSYLEAEQRITQSILQSPLHKHSKAALLWQHRIRLSKTFSNVLKHDTHEIEMLLVMQAGNAHPKNYHAWNHARRHIQHGPQHLPTSQLSQRILAWCYAHPRDTSAWSFFALYRRKGQKFSDSEQHELLTDIIDSQNLVHQKYVAQAYSMITFSRYKTDDENSQVTVLSRNKLDKYIISALSDDRYKEEKEWVHLQRMFTTYIVGRCSES